MRILFTTSDKKKVVKTIVTNKKARSSAHLLNIHVIMIFNDVLAHFSHHNFNYL